MKKRVIKTLFFCFGVVNQKTKNNSLKLTKTTLTIL